MCGHGQRTPGTGRARPFCWKPAEPIETPDALLSEKGPHPFAGYFVFGDTAVVQPLYDALQ
jgi:hypothetical protein